MFDGGAYAERLIPGYTTRGVRGILKKVLNTSAVKHEFANKTSALPISLVSFSFPEMNKNRKAK